MRCDSLFQIEAINKRALFANLNSQSNSVDREHCAEEMVWTVGEKNTAAYWKASNRQHRVPQRTTSSLKGLPTRAGFDMRTFDELELTCIER